MSKRIIIIIITVVVIASGFFVWYYLNAPSAGTSTSGTPSGFKNLFPFGSNPSGGQTSTSTSQTAQQQPANVTNYTAKLREISSEPVAGAGIAETKSGATVRYIEKATGHIFNVELFSPNSNRLTNTTIPLVYDALWSANNGALIARSVKSDNQTVVTYALVLKSVSTTTESLITTVAFPSHVSDISVFGNNFFYLISNESNSAGYISGFDGKNQKQIWNSPMRELNSQFINANTVALTTKPAPNILGYTYLANSNGTNKKLLGDIPGLSTLVSPDASQALYIAQTDSVQMFYANPGQGQIRTITPVTFPEKCVWSKKAKNIVYCAVPRENLDGSSLTDWYQGTASFTDDIWKYDLGSGTSSMIENLSDDAGMQIDAIKPILSDSEKYLIFENKIDNTLWSLDLSQH